MDDKTRLILQQIDFDALEELSKHITLLRFLQGNTPPLKYLLNKETIQNIRSIELLIPYLPKFPVYEEMLKELRRDVDTLTPLTTRMLQVENTLTIVGSDITILKADNQLIKGRLAILERDNKYLILLQNIRNNLNLIYDNYEKHLQENVGLAMTYIESADISADMAFYTYLISVDFGTFETYPIERQYTIFDRLTLRTYSYTVRVNVNIQDQNVLTIISNGLVILTSYYNSGEYIQVNLYRHISKVSNTLNSAGLFNTQLQVGINAKRYIPVVTNGMPSNFSALTLLDTSNTLNISIGTSTKFTADINIPDETGIFAFIPQFLVVYESTRNELIDFTFRIAYMYQFNILLLLMDELKQTTTQLGIDDDDYNTTLESQVLSNTQSIAQILNVLDQVPLYTQYDFALSNEISSIIHDVPSIIISSTYTSPGYYDSSTQFGSDGLVSNTRGSISVHSLLSQNSIIDTAERNQLQSVIYEDDNVIIIALLTLIRTKPNGETIIGGGRQKPIGWPNAISLSGPTGSGNSRYITYNTSKSDTTWGNLIYTDTYTDITLNSIFIGFKGTFATPTNLQIAGSLQWNCCGRALNKTIDEFSASELVTSSNIKYFGVNITVNLRSYYHFDKPIAYYIVKPTTNETTSGYLYRSSLEIGGNFRYNFYNAINEYTSMEIMYGYLIERSSMGGGQYLDFESFHYRGSVDISQAALTNIDYTLSNIPNGCITGSDITIRSLTISCLLPKAVGYSGFIQAINANEMSLSSITAQLGLLIADIERRLTTVESQIAEMKKVLDELTKSKSLGSVILDMILDVVLTTVVGAAAPLLGSLFSRLVSTVLRSLAKAAYYVATRLVSIGKSVISIITYRIKSTFVALCQQLSVLVNKFMIRKGKVSTYTARLTEAFNHSKSDAFHNIPIAMRNILPEIQWAEAVNHYNVHSRQYLNLASDAGDAVVSYTETNFHGLTKLGKAPVLRQPTINLLNSKFGARLIKANKAPAHAYIVNTEVRKLSENSSKLTRYVSGVVEGVDDVGLKGVYVNSMKFEFILVNGDSSKFVSSLVPRAQSDFASDVRLNLCYKKYFPKGLHNTADSKYIALASKFAGIQSSTLKSMPFALPSTHRMAAAHEVFKIPRRFDYNLLTNNCQSFATDLRSYLLHGFVSGSLKPQSGELSGAYANKLLSDLESVA
uniref:Nsp1 n=1 Tax=Elemess virus TaxID=2800913 RepID=A0A894KPJ6_9VIRU|nr:MAG: Nsp1 [Elemess virus]